MSQQLKPEHSSIWIFVTPFYWSLVLLLLVVAYITSAPAPLPKIKQQDKPITKSDLVGVWDYSVGSWESTPGTLNLNHDGTHVDLWQGKPYKGVWTYEKGFVKLQQTFGINESTWYFPVSRDKSGRLISSSWNLRKR